MPDGSKDADEVVGVVLTAGGSTRMGSPKGLLKLDGEPLLRRHLQGLSAVCTSLRVVVGRHGPALRRVASDLAEVVDNPDWQDTGPRESLLLALCQPEPLAADTRVVVTPVDVPPAPPEVLRALLDAGPLAVPVFHGQRGHPVVVRVREATVGLRTGTLRDVLADGVEVVMGWPDTTVDFDTPEAWRAWLATRTAALRQHGA